MVDNAQTHAKERPDADPGGHRHPDRHDVHRQHAAVRQHARLLAAPADLGVLRGRELRGRGQRRRRADVRHHRRRPEPGPGAPGRGRGRRARRRDAEHRGDRRRPALQRHRHRERHAVHADAGRSGEGRVAVRRRADRAPAGYGGAARRRHRGYGQRGLLGWHARRADRQRPEPGSGRRVRVLRRRGRRVRGGDRTADG